MSFVCALFLLGQATDPRQDVYGDPLPKDAIARMGTVRLRHGAEVRGVSFAPDGRVLASAGADERIRLWDPTTGKEIRQHVGHDLCFNSVAYSPDGKTLAAAGGSADSRVYLWDAATGKELHLIKGETDVDSLTFSPDSERLAWTTLTTQVTVWDRKTNAKKRFRVDTARALECVTFSPDGKLLAVGGEDDFARLLDSSNGKLLQKFEHPEAVECLRFSPDGALLASAGGLYQPIRIWQLKTAKLLHELKVERQLDYGVAFSPDGKTLASELDDGICLWDMDSGRQKKIVPATFRARPKSFHFARDGKTLGVGYDHGTVGLWDVERGKELFPTETHRAGIHRAIFLPGDRAIVTASVDGAIRLWDAETGRNRETITCSNSFAFSLAAHPNGKLLAWGGHDRDKRIHFYDLAARKETATLAGHKTAVADLAFSSDGSRLVSSGTLGALKTWDVAGQRLLAEVPDDVALARVVIFHPDGKRVISGGRDSKIRVWDAGTGKLLSAWEAYDFDDVEGLAMSADGKLLASAPDLDDPIRIWNADTGKLVAEIPVGEKAGGISAVALSPDGKQLAFPRSLNPEITVWDIAGRKRLQSLTGHSGNVYSLMFSADGSRLLSSSGDTAAIVWQVAR